MGNDAKELQIDEFVHLKKDDITASLEKLERSSQSIQRWLQYCLYHYDVLSSINVSDLALDRIGEYQRTGESVPLRYVYEANIMAFLHSLHALLDSFPYLLNLFIPVENDPEKPAIKWSKKFLEKYKNYKFHNELLEFFMDETFNKLKGYDNIIKHKHHIRIVNKRSHLEFEKYEYKMPDRKGTEIKFHNKTMTGENIMKFLEDCHDKLIPSFFLLCDSILEYKRQQIS